MSPNYYFTHPAMMPMPQQQMPQQMPQQMQQPQPQQQQQQRSSRRTPKLAMPPKQFRGVRSMKDLTESVGIMQFRFRMETTRSFELEDDMEFCPTLLTDADMSSMGSASEQSSLASSSPGPWSRNL